MSLQLVKVHLQPVALSTRVGPTESGVQSTKTGGETVEQMRSNSFSSEQLDLRLWADSEDWHNDDDDDKHTWRKQKMCFSRFTEKRLRFGALLRLDLGPTKRLDSKKRLVSGSPEAHQVHFCRGVGCHGRSEVPLQTMRPSTIGSVWIAG